MLYYKGHLMYISVPLQSECTIWIALIKQSKWTEYPKRKKNYLKAIFKISERENKPASTNAISNEIKTSAASVTDMLKRLAEKALIHYEKYKGVTLTAEGSKIAD